MADKLTRLDAERLMHLTELGMSTASLLHDLRQPVFSLRGLIQRSISRGQLDAETSAALMTSLDHLSDLVVLYGEMGLEREGPFDVRACVQNAVNLVQGRVKREGVRLELTLGPALIWTGNVGVFLQMVVNLLSNALDSLTGCDRPEIILQLCSSSVEWKLRLSDNGPGVSKLIQAQCFEAYVTSKSHNRGTGLGLYIARQGARRNGGELCLIDSQTGAVFEAAFTFPKKEVSRG